MEVLAEGKKIIFYLGEFANSPFFGFVFLIRSKLSKFTIKGLG